MNIGLYLGSFNPIHIGHLVVASQVLENTSLDQVWFVVSPQSPFKTEEEQLDEHIRLEMVDQAIAGDDRLKSSDIEFELPRPSYTIETLRHLIKRYPDHHFFLIMGSDNLNALHLWKDYAAILEEAQVYVYKRQGFDESPLAKHPRVQILETPLLNISSTFIRENIQSGKSVKYLVSDSVLQTIEKYRLYR